MHVGVPSTNRPAVPWVCRGCAVTVPGLCCAGIRTMNWLPHTLPVSPSPLPPVSIVSIVSIVLDFVGRMRETARAGVGGWSAAWAGTGEPGKRGRQSHSANCIRHQSLSAWVTQLLTIPPHTPGTHLRLLAGSPRCSPFNTGRFKLEDGWNKVSAAGELRPPRRPPPQQPDMMVWGGRVRQRRLRFGPFPRISHAFLTHFSSLYQPRTMCSTWHRVHAYRMPIGACNAMSTPDPCLPGLFGPAGSQHGQKPWWICRTMVTVDGPGRYTCRRCWSGYAMPPTAATRPWPAPP